MAVFEPEIRESRCSMGSKEWSIRWNNPVWEGWKYLFLTNIEKVSSKVYLYLKALIRKSDQKFNFEGSYRKWALKLGTNSDETIIHRNFRSMLALTWFFGHPRLKLKSWKFGLKRLFKLIFCSKLAIIHFWWILCFKYKHTGT